jgi:putative FmdB family regulatory protein
MPIYEYRCSACGHELEILQKMSDKALTDCPSCGKSTLLKKVSAAGFQLKGSGWYVTDFRDNKKPAAGAKGKDSEKSDATTASKESGSGDSASSDSKDAKPNKTATSGKVGE